uniref:Protein YIF1 n=1 Tax=Capra hircus TaxID=9925 RepID=A0A8C2R6P0_CAPHI
MAYHSGYGAHGSKHRARAAPDPPPLFDDTSGGYSSQPGGYPAPGADVAFNVNHLLGDPMANMAMAYGSSIASHGKDMMNKELHRFVSVNKLKYFFAVDTAYVAKKLGLLVFPYTHQNWEVQYSRDVPLPPRQDLNAPDLYIPTMAFITYVLLAGMALGIQKRFSPEVLGLCASTALVWVVMEVLALLLGIYLATVRSDLSTFHLLAYSGYKYVGMILSVLTGLLFGSDGYYVALAWTSSALMYFIVRSLRTAVLGPDSIGGPVPQIAARTVLALGLQGARSARLGPGDAMRCDPRGWTRIRPRPLAQGRLRQPGLEASPEAPLEQEAPEDDPTGIVRGLLPCGDTSPSQGSGPSSLGQRPLPNRQAEPQSPPPGEADPGKTLPLRS